MAKVLINCEICDKEFEREKGEINRSRKLGRKIYCSSKCSGKGNAHHLGEHLSKGRPENLLQNNGRSRRDEYTQFKWFMRVISKRTKEYDIDLPYLKQVWNEQKGICPLTGWKLDLPKHSGDWRSKENKMYRASLDRIDSNKGYIKGNVRYISVIANYCKNTFTDDEVMLFCESVYKQRKKNDHN